jgi:hypothetical protein
MMGEYDEFEEMDDLESEAAASRRQFTILMLGMGGILIVAVAVFAIVLLSRNGTKSDIELTNEAVLATNQAIEDAILATETAEVVQRTADAVAMVATQEAEQQAAAASATAASETATAQPTPTGTPTPTKPFVTPTDQGGDGTAIAQLTGTPPTPTRTPFSSGTTPDTGIGGLGAVLVAAVLIVVMFAARRLRTAT